MSILEKYNKIFTEKDEDGMNEILHDDYKFTMHASGKVLSKSDVISWAMSDDIAREKVRIVYENDEIEPLKQRLLELGETLISCKKEE